VLREARRWKAVAVSLGWKRPRATPIRPTMVFLPPLSAESARKMEATVRRIIESTDARGGT
jgi:hypothetical protein